MITFLRDLCSKDLGLKLFSFALALLIYSTIRIFAFKTNPSDLSALHLPMDTRTFPSVPVVVMSSAADVHQFRVSPEEVSVTVQGEARVLAHLQVNDIRALVDLTGIETAHDLRKRIEVSVPTGLAFRVVPANVLVVPPRPTPFTPAR